MPWGSLNSCKGGTLNPVVNRPPVATTGGKRKVLVRGRSVTFKLLFVADGPVTSTNAPPMPGSIRASARDPLIDTSATPASKSGTR